MYKFVTLVQIYDPDINIHASPTLMLLHIQQSTFLNMILNYHSGNYERYKKRKSPSQFSLNTASFKFRATCSTSTIIQRYLPGLWEAEYY